MTKYLDLPPLSGNRCRTPNIRMYKTKGVEKRSHYCYRAILFVYQNDRKYTQIFETELNLNDLEKLTTEDEIKMDDQDEHAIDQVRR